MNDVDYGPLEKLIGRWEGDKGMDVSPEPDGTEENPYYEVIEMQAGGDLSNAERQKLAVVKYTRLVWRKSTREIFHDQMGYYMWDADAEVIMHSYAIPRAVTVTAGGKFAKANLKEKSVTLEFSAKADQSDFGIAQSTFMRDNAKTLEYTQKLTVNDSILIYNELTVLDIYGRQFNHKDSNTLTKVL